MEEKTKPLEMGSEEFFNSIAEPKRETDRIIQIGSIQIQVKGGRYGHLSIFR